MERMKTFFKYAMWIILFFIFSEIMINLNLETAYKDIGRKDKIEEVVIYQAQATKINGRIKGTIYNKENKIKSKYLKIDLYSERDIYLGSKYVDISNMRENETRQLEIYFKVQDVDYYEVNFTNEKQEGELPELLHDLTKSEVLWGTFLTFLIFW